VIRRLALGAAVTLAGAGAAPAQSYTAGQLHCARFGESTHSDIETETGGRVRRARAEREGIWSFRARDTAGGLVVDGWYDSLALRHGARDSLSAVDTDGLIGGRYRGLLHPAGDYRELATPFVPDEVAEAVDAAGLARDLFPPLPPTPLAVGDRWRDRPGLELERLPDSVASGRPVQRYLLHRRSEAAQTVPAGDTVPVPLTQITTDEATIVWDPERGLLHRSRSTVIDATIPAGGRVRTPARSRVVQRAELVRLPPADACR
jgi:hypothetical protein